MSTSASPMPQAAKAAKPFLMIPHEFLEEVMPVLSGDAFKVALVAYREIVGRHRPDAALSYTELERATGIHRPATLAKALKEAIRKGVLILCEAVGLRRTKLYTLAERWMTTTTGVVVKDDSHLHLMPTTTPVVVVPLHHETQNYVTSGSSSATPDVVVESPEDAPEAVPEAAPYKAYRNVKETKKETYTPAVAPIASIAPEGAADAGEEEDVFLKGEEGADASVALVPLAETSHSPLPDNAPGSRLHETKQPAEREVSPELESLWNVVRSNLRLTLQNNNNGAAYDNWLEPLKVIGCEGTVLYLQAKTTYNAQMFQQRFAAQASGELSKLIHKDAEVRCLPPPQSTLAALDAIEVSAPEPETALFPEPEPPEEKPLTLKALVGRDLFHFPPTGWNKGAAKAVQNVVNQLLEAGATPEIAPRVIDRFKRERPTGSVYEFLMKLPALVAAVGVQ
jgi:hypothetical protein